MTGQATDGSDEVIEAAGGVLWRDTGTALEFALIHRPRYDDWSLPKGKLDPGESHAQAAVREVREETGYAAELGAALGDVAYRHKGRPKRVQYWGMRALGGAFEPNAEVDQLRWVSYTSARALLSYEHDRALLDRFVRAHTQDRDAG
jgi:8-oxo-dGTP diphosphatase